MSGIGTGVRENQSNDCERTLCHFFPLLVFDPTTHSDGDSRFVQYDLSVSTFSPDGRVFQVEYAQKAVDSSGYVANVHLSVRRQHKKRKLITIYV